MGNIVGTNVGRMKIITNSKFLITNEKKIILDSNLPEICALYS